MRRMTLQDPALAQRYVWPGDDLTVIPDWVYTDETIYAREVERIFHGPTWNYVALEVEVPISERYVWPGDDLTVIPDWVYTDETIYAREVERIFHGPTWNYVALEVEVP